MADYIPGPDDEFDTYLRDQFGPYVATNFAALGLTAGDNTALQTEVTAWGYTWPAYTNALAALTSATSDKDEKRAAAEVVIRRLAQKVQVNAAVTDMQKGALGITIRKTTKTPAPVPTSVPVLSRVDTSTRAILRLFFADSGTPDSKAKPPGVQSVEIREQIGGTAPTDPNAMAFLAIETRAPYRADFEAMDVGKTVCFALRWVNTRGQPGPWSQIFNAVIPG
ncbi:MAG TPA: hypothetical protein VGF13_01480 [Verrucomicrobiae bacterium]|jgi:hypothetical protein